MSEESPGLEEVVNALPARAIDASEVYRLSSAGDELLYIPSSTIRVDGGVRISTISVKHKPSDHRYLVGWDPDSSRWFGINDWPPGQFQPYELEYDVDDWLEEIS